MKDDYLDYGKLIDEAMHYVVRTTLRLVAEHGILGDHHFFITFDSGYPGVMLSDELKSKYPEEMTIVVQHQFWDLEVEEDRFSIVLSFDSVKQNLTVPFNSLISFADPGVKFGLQFRHEVMLDPLLEGEEHLSAERAGNSEGGVTDGSNVVTLDSFRKK